MKVQKDVLIPARYGQCRQDRQEFVSAEPCVSNKESWEAYAATFRRLYNRGDLQWFLLAELEKGEASAMWIAYEIQSTSNYF